MAQVFISYSTKDTDVANHICEILEKNGIQCWIAPRNIVAGTDWASSISKAIADCTVFLLIYSENSSTSTQVPRELTMAGSKAKHIIPYRMDETPINDKYEYYLSECHWVTANPAEKDYKDNELIFAAKTLIESSIVVSAEKNEIQNHIVINNIPPFEPSAKAVVKKNLVPLISIFAAAITIIAVAAIIVFGGNGGSDIPVSGDNVQTTTTGEESPTSVTTQPNAAVTTETPAEATVEEISVTATSKTTAEAATEISTEATAEETSATVTPITTEEASTETTAEATEEAPAEKAEDENELLKMAEAYLSSNSYVEAFQIYVNLSEKGNIDAMIGLAWCYNSGEGTEKNQEEAFRWYKKAAEAGNSSAMYELALCYDYGNGVEQDWVEAFQWYKAGAEAGNVYAMESLGDCYSDGIAIPTDEEKAFKWYKKSAEAGNENVMYKLGNCYYYGRGVAKDRAKAVECYIKGAESGDSSAMNSLGYCYYFGYGIEKNYQLSLEWYKKAYDAGYTNGGYQNALDNPF